MFAERSAVVGFYLALLRRNVVHKKLSEITLPDETYARAVLFFGSGKSVFFGDASHLGLGKILKRKQNVR